MGQAEPSPIKVPETPMAQPASTTLQTLGRIAAVLVAIAITVGIVLVRDQIRQFAAYGYPGVFVVSLIGNATLFLPAPSFAIVFAVGGALNPIAVGIVAGLGATIGEMTGYLVGIGGRSVVENRAHYHLLEGWMRKAGIPVVFGLGLVPNLFFDVGAMMAGALRMPAWQFMLAAWAGKSIRFIILAYSGHFLFGP